MAERGALRALAHVLVQKTVEAEECTFGRDVRIGRPDGSVPGVDDDGPDRSPSPSLLPNNRSRKCRSGAERRPFATGRIERRAAQDRLAVGHVPQQVECQQRRAGPACCLHPLARRLRAAIAPAGGPGGSRVARDQGLRGRRAQSVCARVLCHAAVVCTTLTDIAITIDDQGFVPSRRSMPATELSTDVSARGEDAGWKHPRQRPSLAGYVDGLTGDELAAEGLGPPGFAEEGHWRIRRWPPAGVVEPLPPRLLGSPVVGRDPHGHEEVQNGLQAVMSPAMSDGQRMRTPNTGAPLASPEGGGALPFGSVRRQSRKAPDATITRR